MTRRPSSRWRLLGRLLALGREATPQVAAVLIFFGGALMLVEAVTPAFADRLRTLGRALPPILIDLSHFLASVIGLLLLLLAAGLWRRRRGAYWTTLAALLSGAVFSLLKGLDWEEAAVLVGLAALLAPCRPAFNRRSRLLEPLRPGWLVLLVGAVAGALWLGFFAYRDVAYTDELWWRLLVDREVSGFIRAAAVLSLLTLAIAAISLLSSPGARRSRPAAEDLERAGSAVTTGGDVSPEAWLALLGDKQLMFSDSGQSFIAYAVRGRRWIAMGGPAGLRSERQELLWAFARRADSYGGAAVFYSVGEDLLGDLATLGLAIRKVGETAVVRPSRFSLEGKARQNLRTAINRAEREGATFQVLPAGSAHGLAADLRAVSDAWLARHAGSEKAFSLGRFHLDYLDLNPLAVVRRPVENQDRIVAFASLMTGREGEAGMAAIDLMRFAPEAPPAVMDYLVLRLIDWARSEGLTGLDLGLAPLAGLENRRLAPIFARVGALVFEEGGALYGFEGLRAWKAKFEPDWRPRFIAAPVSTPLPLALLDVALETSGGWLGMLGLKR